MSKHPRKRAHSTAFEHPFTPTKANFKAKKPLTPPSSPRHQAINDENQPPANYSSDTDMSDEATVSLQTARGIALQELVEITGSNGKVRPKLTLGDEPSEAWEHEWEKTPFRIWEDVDVVAERMGLGEEE